MWNWLSRLAPLVWLARVLRRLGKFMPGGSWWDMGGGQDEEQRRATLRRTFERMWELVAPDRLLLAMAFFFLVSSAVGAEGPLNTLVLALYSFRSQRFHERQGVRWRQAG